MAELIVALDFPDRKKALSFVESLAGVPVWLKIGLQLFIAGGPALVEELEKKGHRIFLDLKLYDIPNTVFGAVQSAATLGVDMLTLHLQGGEKMCLMARDALQGNRPLLMGVTALTSFADGEMPCLNQPVRKIAGMLAGYAARWGLPGIVCSALEVGEIKKQYPALLCVCPGIRPGSASCHDQSRVATPAQAARDGADYLVMGRPIIQAPDPAALCDEIINIIA